MSKQSSKKSSKLPTIVLVVVLVLLIAGAGVVWFFINRSPDETSSGERVEFPDPIYSILTGEEISDEKLNSSPTFCIQIPNGSTDGARPQVGLREAGVVFEAIAETGITRFAAVFQNPTSGIIGPIRSLRPYYLDWDTPFDCTVVHAGGSAEALSAIASGGQRNLDESTTYMWRESNSSRLWNNLFTSPTKLMDFNRSKGYETSSPKTLPRQTPEDAESDLKNRKNCSLNEATGETECSYAYASNIRINFSGFNSYNTVYNYDPKTNTYLRSYATGDAHMVYDCPAAATSITADCNLTQVSPSAVVVMHVQEHTMSDNYHESITTLGRGNAHIFQNGTVIEATWTKTAQASQIVFRDLDGNEIAFTPGQLWIAAVPQFGSLDWEEIISEEVYAER